MHQEEAAAEFSTQTTLLLIQCVSRHWDLYSANNRSQLFHTVSKELQLHGIQLSSEKLRKKWNNLIVTYKRARERSGIAGKPRTTWEYFQLLCPSPDSSSDKCSNPMADPKHSPDPGSLSGLHSPGRFQDPAVAAKKEGEKSRRERGHCFRDAADGAGEEALQNAGKLNGDA
ncbi:UNVERIFIED_CONTAM: hypothetical protein FKN15_077416 [Acipenser sinensis]